MSSTGIYTILVVDAEPVARFGLGRLIEGHQKLRVCSEAGNGVSILDLCSLHKPSILLLDVALSNGLAVARDVPQWSPETRVVVFACGRDLDALAVQRAFKAGAYGYLSRQDSTDAVLDVLLAVGEGKREVGPLVRQLLLRDLGTNPSHSPEVAVNGLSDRELQVFRLIGRGLTTRIISTELKLSVKTVETHRQHIREKMGLANGNELQRQAVLFAAGKG